MDDRFDRIERKLDKIDSKIDNFQMRVSRLEAWVKGHSSILFVVFTGLTSLAALLISK